MMRECARVARARAKSEEYAQKSCAIFCACAYLRARAMRHNDERGRRVEPDVIRRFKLNLLGRRSVDAGAREASQEIP